MNLVKWINKNSLRKQHLRKQKRTTISKQTQPKWKVYVENDYREGTGGGDGTAAGGENVWCMSDRPELCDSVTV